ncbi:MAG TPA: hypothetical protein ENJ87_05785 [Gammaproteobacteria bacterium]|nr:hypothetical protein [Gammaproteobacteria bacterium]
MNPFQLATLEYQQEHFSEAKKHFEQALKLALSQGRPTSSIYYNLGSVCYRLKQYDQSKLYFKKLIQHDNLRAVAYYNLALIENKLSEKKSAIHYLKKSKKYSTDKSLSRLINKQLLKISGKRSGKFSKTTKKDWHAYLYLSPGYDSNIRFAPLEVASNESGSFIQTIAAVDKKIAGEGYGVKKQALLATATVFLSNYLETDFNDFSLYDIGLRYLVPVSKWRNSIDLNLKRSTYGHEHYQQVYAVTLRTRRTYPDGDLLRLRYRYEQIESLNTSFSHLEGSRQKLRAGYQFRWPADSMYLWYELEMNDRENTVRRNYSPTRNAFRLRYEKKFNKKNKAYIEASYRHSNYDRTPTQDRKDRRTDFFLAFVSDIAKDWQLQARWGYRRNRSTESEFSYDRHTVLLTMRLAF